MHPKKGSFRRARAASAKKKRFGGRRRSASAKRSVSEGAGCVRKKEAFRRAEEVCVRKKEAFRRAEEVCVRTKESFWRAEEVCVRKKCVSHPSTNQRIKSSVPPSEAMPCVERQ